MFKIYFLKIENPDEVTEERLFANLEELNEFLGENRIEVLRIVKVKRVM